MAAIFLGNKSEITRILPASCHLTHLVVAMGLSALIWINIRKIEWEKVEIMTKGIIYKGLLLAGVTGDKKDMNLSGFRAFEGPIRVIYSNKLLSYTSDYTSVRVSVQSVNWIKKVCSKSMPSLNKSYIFYPGIMLTYSLVFKAPTVAESLTYGQWHPEQSPHPQLLPF